MLFIVAGKNYAKEAIKNRKTVLLSKHFVKAYFVSFSSDPIIKNFQNDVNGHNGEENDLLLVFLSSC